MQRNRVLYTFLFVRWKLHKDSLPVSLAISCDSPLMAPLYFPTQWHTHGVMRLSQHPWAASNTHHPLSRRLIW